jgi:hypothetical protein
LHPTQKKSTQVNERLTKDPKLQSSGKYREKGFFFFDSFGNSFLLMIPKAQATKPDIDK